GAVRKLVFKIPTPEYEPAAHIIQLCKAINLPDDASDGVIDAVKRIPADTVRKLTESFFADAGTNPSFDELAEEIGVSAPICNLTMYMLFAKQTYYNYLEKGISADIYYDSMTDFTVWNTACMRKTGAPGLLQIGWLANTLRESLYRLGRFQYQPTTFDHSEYRFGDYVIRRGDPVITIHIPEGEPLTDAVRMDSYRRAEAFFGRHVFVCESWLLYPAHRDFLQKNSNIIRFMDDFVMLSSHESRGSLGDMWRMYGFSCDHTDFANLPENTGMQRAYKKHLLESGSMTGGGYGILIVENGTIINK
ncbi:MAG: acyltransferase domain-containing protein, partial [Eubacteriales bacterium]